MTYAQIENDKVAALLPHPGWRGDDGELLSDEALAEHGILRVEYRLPEHDPRRVRVHAAPREQWTVEEGVVRAAYVLEPIPFEELQANALAEVNAEYTARTSVIAQGYPDYERESWPVQIEEANALLASESADTPWIDAAAASRGITRLDLAQRIKANDVAYRRIHGALSGVRQALETQVMAVPDDEHAAAAFAAIQWPPDQATDPT